MITTEDFKGRPEAWCPGCGNFGILNAFKMAMVELGIKPHEIVIVSGIGQAGKFPHYTRCNTFNGLHGRSLPVATAIKTVNPDLKVFVFTGDGDCYGEGGNHLIHAIRRNPDIKLFVHDNQVYGLTKGQASPTTSKNVKTKAQPFGVIPEPLNPIALSVALGASFVARGFAGDVEHLKEIMKYAVTHKGFSVVDILQPCITFNKVNTYEWYRRRVYKLDREHDPKDRLLAFERSLEWGEKIPLGIIYQTSKPTFEEHIPFTKEIPLVKQMFDFEKAKIEIEAILSR